MRSEGARRAVPVTVAEARQQEVRVELYSVGRVVSRNTPQLAAEIDARVVELLVDEGESVVQGAGIDPARHHGPRVVAAGSAGGHSATHREHRQRTAAGSSATAT